MPRKRPSSLRKAFLWHGRTGYATFSVLPGASTGLAASVVALERARLEPGDIAKALTIWRWEAAHPGVLLPYDVHHAWQVLETALAALPLKASRELRAHIPGTRPGRHLPVLGVPRPSQYMAETLFPAPLPAENLFLDWELGNAGWADCRIGDERSERRLHFGYCANALRDLLVQTASVIAGRATVARFSFDAEPAQFRWELRALPDGIQIRISHTSGYEDDAEQGGALLWRSCQPRIRLASTFADAAQHVLDDHGEDGYLRRWVAHPFPIEELRELRRLAH